MTGIFYLLLRLHGGGTDTEIRVSTESRPWRRKSSRRSSRDSNPRPFKYESGALTTKLSTPSHAYSAGQNSVADLLLASDPALLVSAPALALVAGATNLSKMAAQCFLFHSFVPFMPHFKTQIDTTDTSSPPSLSVGSLACLWHARLFGTRLITARGLVINQGHVERDSRGPPVFQTIPPLSPVSHFRWPVLQVQGFSFLIN